MSIASEINRLINAKDAIRSAIQAKGVTVPSTAKLDQFAIYISAIEGSGGEVISVSSPVFSFSNNTITITCSTDGSTIYYKESNDADYSVYSSAISISQSGTYYAYAMKDGFSSEVVSYTATYVNPETDYSQEYLTFNITSAGNIVTNISSIDNSSYRYQKNGGSWNDVTSTISVSTGDVVKFEGNCYRYKNINFSSSTAGFSVSGNIMSIYKLYNFSSIYSIDIPNAFAILFKNCSGLTSAQNLILPATSLTNYCYISMFEGCTSLTTAPELPASQVSEGSYSSMFKYCSSLNYIKCLATDITTYRYCLDSWVQYVAASGTFIKSSSMSDFPSGINGIPDGWTVKNE